MVSYNDVTIPFAHYWCLSHTLAEEAIALVAFVTIAISPALSKLAGRVLTAIRRGVEFEVPAQVLCAAALLWERRLVLGRVRKPGVIMKSNESPYHITAQIAKIFKSILVRHWSNTKVSDQCLIDVDTKVFAI